MSKVSLNYSPQTSNPTNNHLPSNGTLQMSPADSMTNSPSNASPTSPRSQHPLQYHVPGQVRQLRPMKSPLYVPAALRPTERPSKSSPMTPPKSLHGSLENLEAGTLGGPSNEPVDLVVENDWIADEDLGEVTGEPTKEHWKPDMQSPNCDSPTCRTFFNLFRRRHHCRHCGHIFCNQHSQYNIPLNQDAKFHPDGTPSRACDICHRHYQRWEAARKNRRESRDNNNPEDGSEGTASTSQAGSGPKPVTQGGLISGTSEQSAGSVPKDWAWSTF